jgi:hypothetical protein
MKKILDSRNTISYKGALISDVSINYAAAKGSKALLEYLIPYTIQDGETPELLSLKLYGTKDYHWILMLLNERFDIRKDWPINSFDLENYIEKELEDPNGCYAYIDADGNIIVYGREPDGSELVLDGRYISNAEYLRINNDFLRNIRVPSSENVADIYKSIIV